MTKTAELTRFIVNSGGVSTAAQMKEAGFLPGSIAYALETGAIDRLTRGVYCSADIFDDEFASISNRWRRCVFSHGSALFLAGLSDRVPHQLDVSVPYGYNPAGIRSEHPDIHIHRLKPELYELGIIEVKTPAGITVKSYCAERAVADLLALRATEGADPQLVRDAVGGYFRRKNADLPKLARMCAARGVENEFRMYLEVLV